MINLRYYCCDPEHQGQVGFALQTHFKTTRIMWISSGQLQIDREVIAREIIPELEKQLGDK